MKKFSTVFILFGLFCIAIVLRWYLLPSHLFFGPEQGRDMLVIRDIVVNHKLTLIGPKTDISGIFHGPLFYYLAAVPFTLFQGNPLAVSLFFVVLHACALLLLYILAFEITNNRRLSIIASTLLAVSFQGIVYSRWLSNPPLSILFSILFFLFLVRFLKGKPWNLVCAAIMYGLVGQVEFINYALFGVVGVAVLLLYLRMFKKIPIRIIFFSVVAGGVCAFGTYILFDLRHDFLITKSLIGLFQGGGYSQALVPAAIGIGAMYIKEVAVTFGFVQPILGIMCIGLSIYGWYAVRRTHKYADIVLLWMAVPVIALLLFRHSVLEQIFVGLIPAWILGVSLGIDALWKKSAAVGMTVLVVFLLGNVYSYVRYIPTNEQVFFQKSQARMRYTDELAVVHAVYRRAEGKPFYFQAFTIPIFWQDGWTYLFWYVGSRTYHYIPVEEDKSIIYVIIPNLNDDPFLLLFQKNWYRDTVSTWGKLTYSATIGEFTIEERQK